MKIACGTVLFRQHPLEKALEAIRGIGFDYVETQAVGPWCPHVIIGQSDPIKYAELVKSFGFKGTTALWMPDGAILNNEQSVESGIRAIEWANAAGIPVVNTGDGHKPDMMSNDDAFKLFADRMAVLLQAAEKHQVVIALEPHGTFSLTSEGLCKLLSVSDSEWLGVNYDACNIHRAYYVESNSSGGKKKTIGTGEREVDVLSKVIDRVKHVHAKDYKDGHCVALGEGNVDLVGCIDLLYKSGYRDAISLETEGDESFEESVRIAQASFIWLNNMLEMLNG